MDAIKFLTELYITTTLYNYFKYNKLNHEAL